MPLKTNLGLEQHPYVWNNPIKETHESKLKKEAWKEKHIYAKKTYKFWRKTLNIQLQENHIYTKKPINFEKDL